jgi:DNA-binding CsgD family transcriptional regulator
VELAVWTGRPGDALAEVRRVLPLLKTPYPAVFCGRLLAAGMRACADLAEQARARRDDPAAEAAAAAADGLATWVQQVGGAPFTRHPFLATIPAERATWDAERTRLAGPSDPDAWSAAAAEGHAPLLAQIRLLAERARIPLHPPAAAVTEAPPPAQARALYGLTGRELAVLRLLAAGRTNAQIAAELYISPRTASVHVSSILRKLGVSGRVQAAAIAERAGLLHQGQP